MLEKKEKTAAEQVRELIARLLRKA